MAEPTPFQNSSGQSYVQNYDFTPHAYVRTLPVQDWVQRAISNAVYAADPNLQIRVSSGGQTSSRNPALRNASGGWTGSTRHNDGGAADFSLVRDGKKLPIIGNEELYQAVTRNLAAQGVPGIGIDTRSGFIHAGGGAEAAWGYEGKSNGARYLPASFATAINEGRQQYRTQGGIPTPPGEIPNVVATQTDTTLPRPIAPSIPTPMPPMLVAQRNLQPVTQNTASLYAGIYPPASPRAPSTDKDLIFDRGISDTVERSIAGQDQNLAAILERRIADAGQKAPMSTAAISYAGQERGPRSIANVPMPRRDPRQPTGMDVATMPRNLMQQELALQGQSYAGMERAPSSGVGRPPRPTGPALSRDSVAQSRLGNETVQRLGPTAFAKPSLPIPTLPAIPNAIPGPARVPQVADRLPAGTWGVPQTTLAATGVVPPAVPDVGVASAMSVIPGFPPMPRPRPLRSGVNVQMPTPMGQRPTLPMPRAITGFPTALTQRPNPNALSVTVNGAGSYSGGGSSGGSSPSQPQTIRGSSTGREYNVGQQYQAGGYRFEAKPDGTFKNLGRV